MVVQQCGYTWFSSKIQCNLDQEGRIFGSSSHKYLVLKIKIKHIFQVFVIMLSPVINLLLIYPKNFFFLFKHGTAVSCGHELRFLSSQQLWLLFPFTGKREYAILLLSVYLLVCLSWDKILLTLLRLVFNSLYSPSRLLTCLILLPQSLSSYDVRHVLSNVTV